METVQLDAYVLDTLMRDLTGHDRQPSAFLVYLCLWRMACANGAWTAVASLRDLTDATGLSRRTVQDALGRLHRRKLITVTRASITAVPEYTVLRPWRR